METSPKKRPRPDLGCKVIENGNGFLGTVYLCIVYCCNGCIDVFTLDVGLLARSQCSEGPATGHLDKGFLGFTVSFKANAEMVPMFPSCHYMLLM
jgi:hypothetical protein